MLLEGRGRARRGTLWSLRLHQARGEGTRESRERERERENAVARGASRGRTRESNAVGHFCGTLGEPSVVLLLPLVAIRGRCVGGNLLRAFRLATISLRAQHAATAGPVWGEWAGANQAINQAIARIAGGEV
jgi:hypothetical protein